jgi:hypothetical protein
MQTLPLVGVAETRLDPQSALALAEQVLAEPRGLATTFNTSKIQAEVGQRFPSGFHYRSFVKTPAMRMRMNDGYVVAQVNGQGGTRVSFHENKRYVMLWGGVTAVILLLVLILFFALRETEPTNVAERLQRLQEIQMGQRSSGSGVGLWMLIGAIVGGIMAAIQFGEMLMGPKKVVELFNQRQAYGTGPHAGLPGQPPSFAGGAQPGFGPPPHHGGGRDFQLQGAPPQPAFPPPPQAGAGFPPPRGYPPQPAPGGFSPPQPQEGTSPRLAKGGFSLAPPMQANTDADNKLRELAQLRDSGVISAADFEQAKATIEAKRAG